MSAPLPERLQQLTKRMLRKKLFLVTMTADVVLFASGPLVSADGAPTGDGLSIFNTPSAEVAQSFAMLHEASIIDANKSGGTSCRP